MIFEDETKIIALSYYSSFEVLRTESQNVMFASRSMHNSHIAQWHGPRLSPYSRCRLNCSEAVELKLAQRAGRVHVLRGEVGA